MPTTFSPSLWLRQPTTTAPPLDHDRSCDVAVVGAGYTGLSAALALAEAGVDVVVLEAEHAGFGASGRNAGHLTPTIGKDLPTLLMMYGRKAGAELVALADEAVTFTEDLIRDRGIACDHRPAGNVIAGIHPGHEKRLAKAVDAATKMGADIRMLDADELDARGLPSFVACGAIEGRGGVLDPGKYVLGLRDLAVRAGATLHEHTPVSEIVEHARGVIVTTPRATVSADRVVLATNAYTPALGLRTGGVVPMRDSQFVTEPLTDEQLARVGWRGGEGIYTVHESLENYRQTADGRIVGGSRYVTYEMGSRLGPDHAPKAFAAIEARFRDRFPELHDVALAGCWSGHVAMNLNFVPYIGPASERGHVVASLGYNGHGLALAGLLGAIAAGMVLGRAEAPHALAARRRIPVPPEPIRWASVALINGATQVADRLTDRKARPRR